jgi:hypothetical protein
MNNELENMRSQLNLLKEEVDRKAKINDKIMRNMLKQRISWVRNYAKFGLYLFPIMLIMFPVLFHVIIGVSWPLTIFGTFLACGGYVENYYTNYLKTKNLFDGDLLDAAKVLARQNKMRTISLMVSIPLSIIFFVWFFIEFKTTSGGMIIFSESQANSGAIMGIIFGLAGLIAGIILVIRYQQTNKELIRFIQEMQKL